MNGQEGLELAVREHPSLIISDYMMPVMDGATMFARIKADPALQNTLIVMMSSMPEATVAERCTGYEAFLRKPFKLFEVTELVQRLVGSSDEANPQTSGT